MEISLYKGGHDNKELTVSSEKRRRGGGGGEEKVQKLFTTAAPPPHHIVMEAVGRVTAHKKYNAGVSLLRTSD